MFSVNQTTLTAIDNWLKHHPDNRGDAPLFISQRTRKALTVSTVNAIIKRMCREVGLKGNYG